MLIVDLAAGSALSSRENIGGLIIAIDNWPRTGVRQTCAQKCHL